MGGGGGGGGELEELKKQHVEITEQELKLSSNETNKLIQGTLSSTIGSTLKEINVRLFPNILYLINVLAVLPVTSCEAERSISTLSCLKTSLCSTMSQEWLTGLACMYIHSDISINVPDIVSRFCYKSSKMNETF